MRIIRNERRIRVLGSIGKYATLAGLLALLVSLIISFARPEWLVPMLVSMTLGLILSIVGVSSPTVMPAPWPTTTR